MSTQLTKIEKAQSRLLFKLMFLAMVMLTTPLIQTTKVKRAATDMKRIYWNEEFFATLDVKLVMFVLAHEVMHIILKHGLRQGHRDHKLWNIACDHVINLLLEEHGFTLWKDCCCDKRFKGMSEEQVYAILEQEQSQGATISPDALGEDLTQSEDTDVNDPAVRAEIENQIDRMVAGAMAQAKLAGSMPACAGRSRRTKAGSGATARWSTSSCRAGASRAWAASGSSATPAPA
jgi:predicted metal-dependent peptidase